MPLQSFMVSIDYLEKFLEIDFFYKLDDKIENKV